MNQLKLTIDQKTFQGILDGQITEISRDVYPHNEDRYIYGEENVDENGNDVIDVRPIQYDELILTAGRGKNAPKIIVNVDKV